VYVVDRLGRLSFLNPAGHRLLGYADGELDGRDVHAAIHFRDTSGEPLASEDCPLLAVLRSGGATRVESDAFTRKDGRVIEVGYTSSAIVEDGEVTGAVVVFRDITDRRAVERRADRLSAEREQAGVEWQRNLLPARLAQVPGVDVAVSFRPVGDEALVGGDFYDVVPAGEGHLLVLGDVAARVPARRRSRRWCASSCAAQPTTTGRPAAPAPGQRRAPPASLQPVLHPRPRHLVPSSGGAAAARSSSATATPSRSS
jgi:PAS domain S-box-containing protein